MINVINEKLNAIEEKENIKILHCVESGSRAWGFASPDSDYDVRFIYIRPKAYYLRLDKSSDVIEWQLDETLDINGWDLQKTLRLLHNSNPTLFEWNASPIVYRTTDAWKKVSNIVNDYFVKKSGLYHYLHTASGNYNEYLKSDVVRLKKYFYVLRPILACKWIIDRGTPPPMLFETLMDGYLDSAIKPAVEHLLHIKRTLPEIETVERIDEINEYIESNLSEIEKVVQTYSEENTNDWEHLNAVFSDILDSF